ncbi:MAG: hydrogenase expression/formation protein HypE, partial [Gemmatimonadetes bacterium]|nr:hydrogenase expression/formation protein HypE [Gemmatimonadota bacterium]
ALGDSAILAAPPGERLAFTTDSFVVRPPIFPGGDLGRIAICGTINDLAVAGAEPLALSMALIIEEGFETELFERIVSSAASTAREAGVPVVTGDTKVVERGAADGLFITTTGIGQLPPGPHPSPDRVRQGDTVLVSGPLAEHGVAVLLEREGIPVSAPIESDVAPLAETIATMRAAVGPEAIRWMRDPTRGGLATALDDLARAAGLAVLIEESKLPIRPPVRGALEILGLDPLHVPSEGRFVAVVAPDAARPALDALSRQPLCQDAAIIGRIEAAPARRAVLDTLMGGRRFIDAPTGELLPRIC